MSDINLLVFYEADNLLNNYELIFEKTRARKELEKREYGAKGNKPTVIFGPGYTPIITPAKKLTKTEKDEIDSRIAREINTGKKDSELDFLRPRSQKKSNSVRLPIIDLVKNDDQYVEKPRTDEKGNLVFQDIVYGPQRSSKRRVFFTPNKGSRSSQNEPSQSQSSLDDDKFKTVNLSLPGSSGVGALQGLGKLIKVPEVRQAWEELKEIKKSFKDKTGSTNDYKYQDAYEKKLEQFYKVLDNARKAAPKEFFNDEFQKSKDDIGNTGAVEQLKRLALRRYEQSPKTAEDRAKLRSIFAKFRGVKRSSRITSEERQAQEKRLSEIISPELREKLRQSFNYDLRYNGKPPKPNSDLDLSPNSRLIEDIKKLAKLQYQNSDRSEEAKARLNRIFTRINTDPESYIGRLTPQQIQQIQQKASKAELNSQFTFNPTKRNSQSRSYQFDPNAPVLSYAQRKQRALQQHILHPMALQLADQVQQNPEMQDQLKTFSSTYNDDLRKSDKIRNFFHSPLWNLPKKAAAGAFSWLMPGIPRQYLPFPIVSSLPYSGGLLNGWDITTPLTSGISGYYRLQRNNSLSGMHKILSKVARDNVVSDDSLTDKQKKVLADINRTGDNDIKTDQLPAFVSHDLIKSATDKNNNPLEQSGISLNAPDKVRNLYFTRDWVDNKIKEIKNPKIRDGLLEVSRKVHETPGVPRTVMKALYSWLAYDDMRDISAEGLIAKIQDALHGKTFDYDENGQKLNQLIPDNNIYMKDIMPSIEPTPRQEVTSAANEFFTPVRNLFSSLTDTRKQIRSFTPQPVQNIIDSTGRAVVTGANMAGNAVATGANMAGNAVTTGANMAGNAARAGYNYLDSGVRNAVGFGSTIMDRLKRFWPWSK